MTDDYNGFSYNTEDAGGYVTSLHMYMTYVKCIFWAHGFVAFDYIMSFVVMLVKRNIYVLNQINRTRWGVSKHDDAFATAAGVNLRGRSRCDIVEVEGMPTPDEVGLWLERNEPVMFRNAIRNWTM